jgi:D-3-phosphoglycerate dehydrogenase
MSKVLVTPRSFGSSDVSLKKDLEAAVDEVIYNPVGRPMKADELVEIVADIDGWIAGLDHIDAEVIAAASRLQVITRYGVGLDRVDLEAATRRGIVVTNTPGANAASVAELAIGLILALARQIPRADRAAKQGDWPRIDGVGLRGKSIGLIGLGAIGSAVAQRLNGFGCKILATDPNISSGYAQDNVQLLSLSDLLPKSDFVSLHVPASPSTVGMVNAAFLAQMKPGAFLVNTARGELIDEQALYQALTGGHLRGAALDCLGQEPPCSGNPLLELPQVIVTPHTGAHTDEAVNAMGRMALQACLAVLDGERPEQVVNPDVYT